MPVPVAGNGEARIALALQFLRRLFHRRADRFELFFVDQLLHLWKQLTLFFLDVVLDVLLQHLHLRLERFVLRVHVQEIRDDALDLEMLFDGLEENLLGLPLLDARIEVPLFNRRVHGERIADLLEDLPLPIGRLGRLE